MKLFELDACGKPIIPRDAESVYRFGMLIRKAEELILQLFSQGLLSGTTHTCLGQEVCALSVVRALSHPTDVVLSNHRNHGHFLTYSGDFLGLIAEIMGRRAGVCGGIGGSQHIAFRHFHSNGVQGGMTAIGVGHALAMKRRGEEGIVTVIVGDGTTGQGLLYESMNLASVWELPLLYVVENNRIAQTTPTVDTVGGSIEARGAAFGLKTWRLDDAATDFLEQVESVVDQVRTSRKAGFLVIDTFRMGPHSKGDDLRDPAELKRIAARDPLGQLGRELDEGRRSEIDQSVADFMQEVHAQALASAPAVPLEPRRHPIDFSRSNLTETSPNDGTPLTVRASLNLALNELLASEPRVLLLGEDLHDPYGGAFKVTAGLSTRFPGRVISTPISEAAVIGAGIGLALAGFRPIIEVMFADFITLAMDQIYNHAVKFPGMFVDQQVPLVVRTPSGGRRGYGPTHSQSMENLMAAVPGLTVVFPSCRHDPGLLLRRCVLEWDSPTLFFEHKLLYGRPVERSGYRELAADPSDRGAGRFPVLAQGSENPDITFVAYGDSVSLAEAVAAQLAEEEVESGIVIPSMLSPLPRNTLVNHLSAHQRIMVIEEAPAEFGFSAELAVGLLEAGYRGKYSRVAPPAVPIPAARCLEGNVLPSQEVIFNRVVEMILEEVAASR